MLLLAEACRRPQGRSWPTSVRRPPPPLQGGQQRPRQGGGDAAHCFPTAGLFPLILSEATLDKRAVSPCCPFCIHKGQATEWGRYPKQQRVASPQGALGLLPVAPANAKPVGWHASACRSMFTGPKPHGWVPPPSVSLGVCYGPRYRPQSSVVDASRQPPIKDHTRICGSPSPLPGLFLFKVRYPGFRFAFGSLHPGLSPVAPAGAPETHEHSLRREQRSDRDGRSADSPSFEPIYYLGFVLYCLIYYLKLHSY